MAAAHPVSRDPRCLLEIAAACQPGLTGRIGQAAEHELVCGDTGNPARVAALHTHWRLAHPEAGPLYWSARTWTQLVWQPIYLTLLGVHLNGVVPRLAHFGQSTRDGAVLGFSLPERGAQAASAADPIVLAARQLRAYLARQWREATGIFPLHAKVAERLAADFLMAALLLVQRRRGLSNGEARELSQRWLAALGMRGCSALVEVPLDDGRCGLALDRKICCQHFRRADASLCSSCPKLTPSARMVLLRQELSAEC